MRSCIGYFLFLSILTVEKVEHWIQMEFDKVNYKIGLGYKAGLAFIVLIMSLLIGVGNTDAETTNSKENKSQFKPTAIIKLPESENALVIEKKTQTLFLYTSASGELDLKLKIPCSTGEIAGIKQKAGDKKTPEGIYFLNDEFEDKYLTPIYGKKAFPTDYPNFIDKRSGKNGSAIWIHGTNKELKPMDSNGCIALNNSNIVMLSDYVTLYSTPVIIVDTLEHVDQKVQKTLETKIISIIEQWAKSLERETYHNFLSYYSPNYLPDMAWWEKWLMFRKSANKQEKIFNITQENMGIYYHDKVFYCAFDDYLTFGDKKVKIGKRELFFEHKNNSFTLIGDTYLKVSEKYTSQNTPLIAAAKTLIKIPLTKDSVMDMINQWLTAWSSKDIDKYATFYTNSFHSDGLNKKKWVNRKRILAKKYNFINVSGSKYVIDLKKDSCDVVFYQDYQSNTFTTKGTKKLKLVNKGGLWKISQESWKKK